MFDWIRLQIKLYREARQWKQWGENWQEEWDEMRLRLKEARGLLDSWKIDGELWVVGYEELKQLDAVLRDTTNVADKRTDGVDSQPDIADNEEEE